MRKSYAKCCIFAYIRGRCTAFMLDAATAKKINDFVYQKPRTVQEIAQALRVNWRTADRYIERIASDEGTIAVRTFREGTRGALKVVFWNNVERMHASEAQEWLFRRIEAGRRKSDFSPFDIYQFVDAKKKKLVVLNDKEYASNANFKSFANTLRSAESQILFFSGNLTFSNYKSHDTEIRQIVEELAREKVSSKILARVEMPGLENVMNVLSINKRVGWNAVEIRHCFHPLRVTIIDNKLAVMKESWYPKNYEPGELKETLHHLYYIYDEEWIEWLQKIFWNFFRNSVDAAVRIKDMKAAKHANTT